MASLSKEFLIGMLIPYPSDDLEKGYNAAIIQILKIGTIMAKEESAKYIDPTELSPNKANNISIPNYRQNLDFLKYAFNLFATDPDSYEKLISQKDKTIEYFNLLSTSKFKLSAIKLLKEITDLSLREAKDITDYVTNKIS